MKELSTQILNLDWRGLEDLQHRDSVLLEEVPGIADALRRIHHEIDGDHDLSRALYPVIHPLDEIMAELDWTRTHQFDFRCRESLETQLNALEKGKDLAATLVSKLESGRRPAMGGAGGPDRESPMPVPAAPVPMSVAVEVPVSHPVDQLIKKCEATRQVADQYCNILLQRGESQLSKHVKSVLLSCRRGELMHGNDAQSAKATIEALEESINSIRSELPSVRELPAVQNFLDKIEAYKQVLAELALFVVEEQKAVQATPHSSAPAVVGAPVSTVVLPHEVLERINPIILDMAEILKPHAKSGLTSDLAIGLLEHSEQIREFKHIPIIEGLHTELAGFIDKGLEGKTPPVQAILDELTRVWEAINAAKPAVTATVFSSVSAQPAAAPFSEAQLQAIRNLEIACKVYCNETKGVLSSFFHDSDYQAAAKNLQVQLGSLKNCSDGRVRETMKSTINTLIAQLALDTLKKTTEKRNRLVGPVAAYQKAFGGAEASAAPSL